MRHGIGLRERYRVQINFMFHELVEIVENEWGLMIGLFNYQIFIA